METEVKKLREMGLVVHMQYHIPTTHYQSSGVTCVREGLVLIDSAVPAANRRLLWLRLTLYRAKIVQTYVTYLCTLLASAAT